MKKILPTLLIILVISFLVLLGIYKTVPIIRNMVDEVFRYAPGIAGEYFRNKSTNEEIDIQVDEVAKYILELDIDRAIDKLNYIKKDNEQIYDKLLSKCLKINPNKTQQILNEVRIKELEKNVLLSIISEIKEDKEKNYKERAEALSNVSDPTAVSYINDILRENIDAYEVIAGIFVNLDDEKVNRILSHLSENDSLNIMKKLPKDKKEILVSLNKKNKNKRNDILKESIMIEALSPKDASLKIGSTNEYGINDLVQIYEYLGPKKSGEILSYLKDDSFIKTIVSEINDYLILTKDEDKFTEPMLKAISIYKQYNSKIQNLAQIYEKSDDKKIADVIKNLYWKSDKEQIYKLQNGEVIKISDKDIAISLLNEFSDKKIATILSYYDENLSTELSAQLALPKL